jgi:ribonuclease HI
VSSTGLGRIGFLPEPLALSDLAATVARHYGLPTVRFTGPADLRVRSVAVLPGSGASLIDSVVSRADVLVTGDVKYHEAERVGRQGLPVVDLPHEAAEGAALERWTDVLSDALASSGVTVAYCAGPPSIWAYSGNDRAPEPAGLDDLGTDAPRHHLFVDGGSRGNPGPAGIGARLETPEGIVVEELADAIGTATNNQAEYEALIAGLEMAIDRGVRELVVFADSELVVRQVLGEYRVKDTALRALHERVMQLMHEIPNVEVRHVPREQNAEADRLVNEAIDAARRR